MTTQEQRKSWYDEIKAMLPKIPRKEGWTHASSEGWVVYGRRKYRGKERFVAGYSHSRMYAHHMNGMTTDRILGYGDTQEAAIAMMREKIEAMTAEARP